MAKEILIPVQGCWVKQKIGKRVVCGHVESHRCGANEDQLRVNWGSDVGFTWIDASGVRSGFQAGWTVQDVPISTTRKPLGPATVIGHRELGGCEQVLVQLYADGRLVWLPFQHLRRIKDVRLRYGQADTGVRDHAERFRLRLLANALENWNHLTGALDRFDVDPLPHQIQLVHRIISSGNFNWLIADDVGLGKTIEVGLLLAALKRKGKARRVLVVAPAGLTRQWQDEMQYKFDQHYRIYGRDFLVQKTEHWKLYDQVIVSIDMAKRDDHLDLFRQSPGWDIVIFDEGHKLTRYAGGERTERYRLAEALRAMTDAFILLSGTPHQGYADRFIALLELIRPDLRQQLHTIESNPEVVSELILRNRKSEVTDADGTFIFHGQQTHRVAVSPSEYTKKFQKLLLDYLRRGYRAGEIGGTTGRAIGFVMTTYRKLASSSIAAIEHALHRRLDRLASEKDNGGEGNDREQLTLDDLAEGGDNQDDLANVSSGRRIGQFFEHEKDHINRLLQAAASVKAEDRKLRIFIDDVVSPLVAKNKKLLIFTEYRATQIYLKEALERSFPDSGDVELINGSMTLDEKLKAIDAFNELSPFMVSTEAGGEGINLHRNCHVMVNYDLPWNPARLTQRIGRLYRYGQQKAVVVFNLHAQDNFDNKAINLMLSRVEQIAQDMAPVGTEYGDRLYVEILGELLDNIDLPAILQSATGMQIERTQQQIEEALQRAQSAKRLQDELFTHVAGYDPNALSGTLGFTMQHVDLFVRGMLPMLEVHVESELYDGRVLEIRLPEAMRGRFAEFAQRTVVRITTDRRTAQRLPNIVLLDFETQFFQFLVASAKSQEFNGFYAAAASGKGEQKTLVAFKLRWQNDQGDPLTEEFVTFVTATNGQIEMNPPFVAHWLVSSVSSTQPPNQSRSERTETFKGITAAAERRLLAESTRFKHPNGLIPLAAADCLPVSETSG